MRRCRQRFWRSWCMRSRTAATPKNQGKPRPRATAAQRSDSLRRPLRPAAVPRCATSWATIPIGVLPTKCLASSKIVLKPAAVRPGARIAIVSPASPFSREEFDRGVDELRPLGYETTYDDDVFARTGTYLSGTPALRAAAFSRAWADPSIAAVMAVRGGYGSGPLLPLFVDMLFSHYLKRLH